MVRIGPVEIRWKGWKHIGHFDKGHESSADLEKVPSWVQKASEQMQGLKVYYLKGRTFYYKVKVMPGEEQGQEAWIYDFYRKKKR